MAAPIQAKGGLGWAILAAALAIPGLLFYNWWSHLKAERQRSISQKARTRVPEAGVFATPAPGGDKLVNPVSASTAAPAADPAAAAAAAAAAPGASSATAGGLPGATPAAAAAPAATDPALLAAAAAGAPTGAAPGGASASVTVSTGAVLVAALPRDPMLSPMDIVRMQQEEMEKRLAEEAMRRAMEEKKRPKPKPQIDIRSFVDLQGIVANPDGENKAIVNDVVVGAGETFDARGHEVKVVRISPAGVTFQYKGKRFVKSVSRDE